VKGLVPSIALVKQQSCAEIDLLRDRLISISDDIHNHPETGHHEFFASKLLATELEKAGFKVELGIAGMKTAFRASLRGMRDGPRIAILAEYDALPEVGHGCGHNIIGTSALGAALGLRKIISQLAGELDVLGCPAEEEVENSGGKVVMVENGIFENVDAALLIHPHDFTYLRRSSSNARGAIEVQFTSIEEESIYVEDELRGQFIAGDNALNAVLLTFDAINSLRQHMTPDTRVNGVITDGGETPDMIPSHAAARFVVKSANRKNLKKAMHELEKCAMAAAGVTHTKAAVRSFRHTFEDMYNLPSAMEAFKANLQTLGVRAEEIGHPGRRNLSDIGNVSHVVPTVYTFIGIGPTASRPHTVEFRDAAKSKAGHDALIVAAKSLAMTSLDFLLDEDLMTRMRREFEEGHPSAEGAL
jgi:amidohydrolase